MKHAIKGGSTDVTLYIFIADSSSTTGGGKTGLAYNTSSLAAYYVRNRGTATSISLATQTVTGAHSDGGFVEVDATNMPGVYRFDLPDAVCAAGALSCAILIKGASGMAPCPIEIQVQDIPSDINAISGSSVSATTAQLGVNVVQLSGDATAADNAESFFDGTGYAGTNNTIPTVTNLTNLPAATTDWLTAAAVKADAVTKIQTGLATPTNITAGTITTVTNLTNAPSNGDFTATMKSSITSAVPTAAAIADAVCDEASAGHTGFIATNLDAAVSTRSTYAGGAVASVTAAVTVGTNNDKTGYSLSVTPLDAAGVRTAIGLASANLDTQLAALPTDADVNAACDTAISDAALATSSTVTSIKAVTDKIDTALSLDGAVYQFTTNALELAPSGGGVGSAPTVEQIRAEMDSNSTKLAAILADTNELQTDWANGGRLDSILDSVSGAATGGNSVLIRVLEDTNSIVGAIVAVYNSFNTTVITVGQTNSYGEVTLNLDDGNYKVRLQKAGYVFTTPESITVVGENQITLYGTALSIGVPADSDACRLYEYCFDLAGDNPLASVTASAILAKHPYSYNGKLHSSIAKTGTYNANSGLLYWDIVRGARVTITISELGVSRTVTIPTTATARLSDI